MDSARLGVIKSRPVNAMRLLGFGSILRKTFLPLTRFLMRSMRVEVMMPFA